MKIKILISDLRKGKYYPNDENDMAELSSHTLSEDQLQAMVLFLYEVFERSKEK